MANEKWIKHRSNPTGTSQQTGQSTNDGWSIVGEYPQTELPQGTAKRLAINVKASIGHIQVFTNGNPPLQGLMEVCLGTRGGTKSLKHITRIPIHENETRLSGPYTGVAMSLLMVQQLSPPIIDTTFGATTNTANFTDLVLWARTYTNGEPQLYAVYFDVMDIQWLVMDMDVLEADGRVRAAENTTPQVIRQNTTMYSDLLTDPTNIGIHGQRWLTMVSCDYEDRDWPSGGGLKPGPLIYFGYQTASGTTQLTTLERKLQIGDTCSQRYNQGPSRPRLQQGGFYAHTIQATSGGSSITQHVQILGRGENLAVASRTLVNRSVTLSIRIDDLPYYAENTLLGTSLLGQCATQVTPTFNGQTPGYFPIILENVAQNGTWNPIVMMQAQVRHQSGFSANGQPTQIRIRNSSGNLLHIPTGFYDNKPSCRVTAQSFYQQVCQANQSYQFVMDCFQASNQSQPAEVQWPYLLMFHDTLNVNNNTTDPKWSTVPPTPITITAEGPLVGSMNALPVAPDSNITQTLEPIQFGSVKGAQGYRRTWPTWAKPRRGWQLMWNGLSASDALQLRSFFNINDSFAFTPPGSSIAIPVILTGEVSSDVLSDGREVISTQVTELLFTA